MASRRPKSSGQRQRLRPRQHARARSAKRMPSVSERGWGPARNKKKLAERPTRTLSHADARGRLKMVDVGAKTATDREAIARGSIAISRAALQIVRAGRMKKGDPLQAARLAGIMAAKQTSMLIPLC